MFRKRWAGSVHTLPKSWQPHQHPTEPPSQSPKLHLFTTKLCRDAKLTKIPDAPVSGLKTLGTFRVEAGLFLPPHEASVPRDFYSRSTQSPGSHTHVPQLLSRKQWPSFTTSLTTEEVARPANGTHQPRSTDPGQKTPPIPQFWTAQ